MVIKNKDGLIKKMDDIAKKSLDDVGENVKVLWKEYIQKRFYDLYPDPEEYVRTNQLIESVVKSNVKKVGNKWTIEIFMDASTVSNPYLIDNADEVFAFSADGFHGTDFMRFGSAPIIGDGVNPNGTGNTRGKRTEPIRTEGRFYEELLAELKSGRLVKEFEEVLKGMNLKVTLR